MFKEGRSIFPNDEAVLRLAVAVLMEQRDESQDLQTLRNVSKNPATLPQYHHASSG